MMTLNMVYTHLTSGFGHMVSLVCLEKCESVGKINHECIERQP